MRALDYAIQPNRLQGLLIFFSVVFFVFSGFLGFGCNTNEYVDIKPSQVTLIGCLETRALVRIFALFRDTHS